MGSIWNALQTLPDDDAKVRCINWALSRLGLNIGQANLHNQKGGASLLPASLTTAAAKGAGTAGSLDDIVEQTEDGRYRVIARDLKVKSRNDAAIRLAHLVIYSNEILSGQQKTSSKKYVVPVLKEWRAYDGNTRNTLAGCPGIKRDGDLLSLDVHSRRDAQNFISQIRDEAVKGSWSASAARTRKAAKKDEQAAK